MQNLDYLEMLMSIAKAQTKRFPNGDEPFKNGCRILEEAGEIVWELNHYERKGINLDKGNSEGKEHMALEAFQLCEVVCQLMQYFDLTETFKDYIKTNYESYIENGYIVAEE
jgi:hypothetical protein